MKAQQSLFLGNYPLFLQDIKARTRKSQMKATQAVNQELIQLYWWIGSEIVKHQKKKEWNSEIMERFFNDVQSSFPGMQGFSPSNLIRMRTFYLSYSKVQQTAGLLEIPPDHCLKISWSHHIILMKKVRSLIKRDWYACKTIENGWSVDALEIQIESDLYNKQRKAGE